MIVTRRSLISRRRHQRDSASDNLGKLEKKQTSENGCVVSEQQVGGFFFCFFFFFVSYLSVAALHILLGISAAADAAFTLSVFRPSPAFPNNYNSNNNKKENRFVTSC
jgi:Flp pilus assembly protein TadB